MGAAQGVGRNLGQADRPDLALLHLPRQRAHRLLDGKARVEPVHVIEIDVIDAEPFQRAVERGGHMLGAVVDEPLALGVAADREFRRQRHALAPRAVGGEKQPQPRLAQALAIDISGVPEIDAEIERGVEQPHRLVLRRLAIEAGKAHAAEANRMNANASGAEGTRDHASLTLGRG